MSRNNSRLLTNITILFLSTVVLFLLWELDKRASSDHKTSANVTILAKTIFTTQKVVKANRDTLYKLMHTTRHDTLIKFVHDTTELYKRYVNQHTSYIKSEHAYHDTIKRMLQQRDELNDEIVALKQAKKNIVFKNLLSVDAKKSVIDSNADIIVVPFKKQARANIFSPQKNYMRVYNKYPNGTINCLPYYDYEQTNDELNLLSFQLRSAYNFTTNTFSYGPGVELKINRLSVNIASLFNTNNDPFKHANISFGTRFDLYRIRFK